MAKICLTVQAQRQNNNEGMLQQKKVNTLIASIFANRDFLSGDFALV
jgi:hypothetical protein